MASFDVAYAWMMDNEDPHRLYKTVDDAPPGACAISGINSAAFPVQFQRISALQDEDRASAVREFYSGMFWNSWLAQLVSDDVAKRVFDASVNMGSGTAVKLLQTAIGAVSGIPDGIDGVWGVETLQRANACNSDLLAAAFRRARCSHYEEIAMGNPARAKYLNSWLVRANK